MLLGAWAGVGWMGKASTDQAMPMILGRPALSYPLLSVAVCVTCVWCVLVVCVKPEVQDVDCVEARRMVVVLLRSTEPRNPSPSGTHQEAASFSPNACLVAEGRAV